MRIRKYVMASYNGSNLIANREKDFFSSKLLNTIGKSKEFSLVGLPS